MEAVKYDDNKPKLGLVPPKAIIEIGKAMTHGANKYEFYNYKKGKGLDWNRYYDALLRHLMVWIDGEETDRESGLSHLAHAGACLSMLIDAKGSGIGRDTRFVNPARPVDMGSRPQVPCQRLTRFVYDYGNGTYDITKSGYFPVGLLRQMVGDGVLDGNEPTYSDYRKVSSMSVKDYLYMIDNGSRVYHENDIRYMNGIETLEGNTPPPTFGLDENVLLCRQYEYPILDNTLTMKKKNTCRYVVTYKNRYYNITCSGMFPLAVLKQFMWRNLIGENAVIYTRPPDKNGMMLRLGNALLSYHDDKEFYYVRYPFMGKCTTPPSTWNISTPITKDSGFFGRLRKDAD